MSSGGGGTLAIEAAEFQRLQTQLIELRTTNYQLKEEQQRLVTELGHLKDTLQTQSRDLDKANKTLQKSKKAKELSSLIEENDYLQQKLLAQEEDFNLQNRTLMEELNKVCEENETLKSQAKRAVGGGGEGGESEQVTRLKAENTALQKSLQALQERLSGQAVEDVDRTELSEDQTSTTPKVMELQLQLDTEREEKSLLTKKLEEIQEMAKREQAQLQSQLDMWVDKAKKKQDSFVHLQEEKEKLFTESRATFDAMVRTKDREIQTLQEQVQKLNKDLKSKDEMSSVGAEIAKQLEALSTEKEEMSLKCSTLTQEVESLAEERDQLKGLAEELGRELHQSKAELGEQKSATEYLNTQLEEAKLSQEQLADQVVRASEDRQTMENEMKTAQKLAEKRKAMLDELSIKGQQSAEELRKKNEEIQEKVMEDVKRLEQELDEERAEVRRLSTANDELPELRRKLKALEEKQLSHDTTLAEIEAARTQEREAHEEELEKLKRESKEKTESLQSELDSVRTEIEEGRERVKELEMAVEDKEEQVRIVEKKSNSMLKDLKRQLQQMQKREERLQEQVTDMREGQTLEQLFSLPLAREQSTDSNSRHSRESSLSSLRGHSGVEAASVTAGSVASPTTSMASTPGPRSAATGVQFASPVSEETRELLGRVTDLQREKWELEERVNHLESTGSALAEDVIQKSEIIKSYFMENKADHTPPRRTATDKMSPMRLVPWAKNREDTLNEINRKMQRALEEALVKNIHLQENIEMLSAELEKYTNKTAATTAAEQHPEEATSSKTQQEPEPASPPTATASEHLSHDSA